MTPKKAEETVRTSVILPRSLHERLGHAAVEDHIAATEIVRQAVAEWLDVRGKRRGRKGGGR